MNNRSGGFTLIELVMVIVLVGVIAIYAAPRLNLDSYDATEAAGEVIEALRYTQALSMEHSGFDSDGDNNYDYYCFQVVGNNYTISLIDVDDNPLAGIANPVTGAATYTQSWGGGITLTPSVNAICFSSRGEPVNTADAPLGNATINVQSGTSTTTVTVEQLTGFIR